jgi:hypothetical protein
LLREVLAVQFSSIKDAGFNRKATLAAPFATVAFFIPAASFIQATLVRQVDDLLLVEIIFPRRALFFARQRPTSSTRFL